MGAARQGTLWLCRTAGGTALPPAGNRPTGKTPSPPPPLLLGFRRDVLGTRLALLDTPPSGLGCAAWAPRASRPLWIEAAEPRRGANRNCACVAGRQSVVNAEGALGLWGPHQRISESARVSLSRSTLVWVLICPKRYRQRAQRGSMPP